MEIDYNSCIKILELQLQKAIGTLKAEHSEEHVNAKLNIDRAIKWLKKGMKHQINPDFEIVKLPKMLTRTPSSEYRLIEDHETDDQKFWTEVKPNNQELRPLEGDFLIMQ